MRFLSLLVAGPVLAATLVGCATGNSMVLKDPSGDDDGPGTYLYPTDTVYAPGSFDILDLQIREVGENVEFKVTVNSTIEDPWNSLDWGGNGFSVQMAQIYIDQDHAAGSGHVDSLPGTYVSFAEESRWEKAVLISPQGRARLEQEIDGKAPTMKDDIVIPSRTSALGRTLMATVSKESLGGSPQSTWGYQVLMQSNEGFPDGAEILARKVNEYEGPHRFGGGTDYNCDPHVLDILMTPAAGGADEAESQHVALSSYTCGDDPSDMSQNSFAVVPMVYPGAGQ